MESKKQRQATNGGSRKKSAFMAVKMAREQQGAFHLDDCIDLAGYAGLLGETRARVSA
jgi:hypothetical protein